METEGKLTGTVFDIQGWSVHDGPGCRTTIFMKGCPMKCSWCCNPEGINSFIEPLFNRDKCNHAGSCIIACEKKAITAKNEYVLHIDKSACMICDTYSCTTACLTGALRKSAYKISVDDIYKIIQRDRKYWGVNGGITLSGGEPFYQPEFTFRLLKRCHDVYIHTAVETCGHVAWKNIERSLSYLDWIYYDLKQLDSEKHIIETTVKNNLILSNAGKLAKYFKGRLIYRMPVIPGYNDSKEHINSLAEFVLSTGRNEINILPLHHLGREKYKLLGYVDFPCSFREIPTPAVMKQVFSIFEANHITCYIGSDTPF